MRHRKAGAGLGSPDSALAAVPQMQNATFEWRFCLLARNSLLFLCRWLVMLNCNCEHRDGILEHPAMALRWKRQFAMDMIEKFLSLAGLLRHFRWLLTQKPRVGDIAARDILHGRNGNSIKFFSAWKTVSACQSSKKVERMNRLKSCMDGAVCKLRCR